MYADIEIDMTILDWIDRDEGNMEGLIIQTEDILAGVDDNRKNADMGPAPAQANAATQKGDNVTAFGYLDIGGKAPVSDGDKEINQHLQGCVEKIPWEAKWLLIGRKSVLCLFVLAATAKALIRLRSKTIRSPSRTR